MTLLNAKPSTIDVDFTIPTKYFDDFQRAKNIVQPSFRVDIFHDDTSEQNSVSHGISVLANTLKYISIKHPLKFYGIPESF